MKHIFTILFCLALTASLQAGIFGSDFAIQFHIASDPRKWTLEKRPDKDGAETFVLEGDSAEARGEIVRLQVAITQESLQSYVYAWKAALLKADPKIDFKEEAIGNDSIIVTYRSAGQTGIQSFIKGKDGVYMLAYQVRSQFKKDEILRIWDSIIRSATLIRSNVDEFA
jgi:hypothetical protein